MGLFSAITSFIAGGKKAKAATSAANTEADGYQKGIEQIAGQSQTTGDNFDAILAQILPFITGGQEALGAQGNLLGLNGNGAQGTAIQGLRDSPLFQSIYQTGADSILSSASATGGLRGGNVQNSLARFGGDTLSSLIESQIAKLGGVATQGLSAAGTTLQGVNAKGTLQEDAINRIAALLGDKGEAWAGGILGKATGKMQQLGAIGSGIDQTIQSAASAFTGGGGGMSAFLKGISG